MAVDYDTETAAVTFDSHKTNSTALIKTTTNADYQGPLLPDKAEDKHYD